MFIRLGREVLHAAGSTPSKSLAAELSTAQNVPGEAQGASKAMKIVENLSKTFRFSPLFPLFQLKKDEKSDEM